MSSGYNRYQQRVNGLALKYSLKIRRQMYDTLMSIVRPDKEFKVLDVGVTRDNRKDSNFFEKWYPYSHQLTAVGIEDAHFLEKEYPGLTFIKSDGKKLPFSDKEFDLVVSFATVEHVGSFENQRLFIKELCRVGKVVCFSTPNRWYPVEFHTVTFFLHWLPRKWFWAIMKRIGREFYSEEKNLNLLSSRDVMKLAPEGKTVQTCRFRLFGWVSNLLFFIR